MKTYLITFVLVLLGFSSLQAQTYTLTVNNGYGSGLYPAGDTVDIWSVAYDTTKTFNCWIGDTNFILHNHEWHALVVMPAQNISVAAQISNMPNYTLHYEKIMGKNNLKNVYYFFPQNPKGVIYLFHGTGGNAMGWIYKTEGRSFVNTAIADTFGIIVTEAEEITLNTDLNGDGKLRWSAFPMDSVNNVDYANLKSITDTLIHRGYFTGSLPRFSMGMSNGGAFSTANSLLFKHKAGISYCASGTDTIFKLTTVPFAFRMALYDDNAEVGPAGNYQAWQHDSTLQQRGICHNYQIHNRQPIYSQRFARIPGVSEVVSQNIYNELVTNNQIDANNYAIYSPTIQTNVASNPANYPNIIALPGVIKLEVLNQLGASNAEHQFYSDFNYESLQFFNHLCNSNPVLIQPNNSNFNLQLFPNPASNEVSIEGINSFVDFKVYVFDLFGKLVFAENNNCKIDISNLIDGVYVVKIQQDNAIYFEKFIKTSTNN